MKKSSKVVPDESELDILPTFDKRTDLVRLPVALTNEAFSDMPQAWDLLPNDRVRLYFGQLDGTVVVVEGEVKRVKREKGPCVGL